MYYKSFYEKMNDEERKNFYETFAKKVSEKFGITDEATIKRLFIAEIQSQKPRIANAEEKAKHQRDLSRLRVMRCRVKKESAKREKASIAKTEMAELTGGKVELDSTKSTNIDKTIVNVEGFSVIKTIADELKTYNTTKLGFIKVLRFLCEKYDECARMDGEIVYFHDYE